MANEEHLAILRQGVKVWNEWRKENPHIKPDLTKVRFKIFSNYSKANFSESNLSEANFSGNSLTETNFSAADLTKVNLAQTNLINVEFNQANLSEAQIFNSYIDKSNFSTANLTKANLGLTRFINTKFNLTNLCGVNLIGSFFANCNFGKADLREANLGGSQAIETIFSEAILTGACIEAWYINNTIKLDNIICDYVYLQDEQQERRPSIGNFAPGEFAQLFHNFLETVDLIFRNGIDWDAFGYSFKKVEVENQGAQLDVQSIEKRGDGVLIVRVAVSPDADKAKIYSEFMHGYECAIKVLETQYQTRFEEKNSLIARQEAQINRLFDIVEQQGSVQKALAENPRKVSNYNIQNPQFASGIVDANTVNADLVGGNIQNNDV